MSQLLRLLITEDERSTLMFALGCYGTEAFKRNGSVPQDVITLTTKISRAEPDDPRPSPAAAHNPPVPVHTPPQPVNETPAPAHKPEPRPEFIPPREQREHWAPKFSASTAGVESLQVEPIKVERKDVAKGKRLVILFTHGGKRLQASCWHEDLFGPIANRARQKTTFYITRSGNYINIVGLLA